MRASIAANAMASLPQRIVSLVPSTTESVCALGAGSRLVGVTRYCTEPAAALAELPRIGGTKNPARERIAALRPDLILGNAEENRAEDLAWLGERFPLLVQTPCTVQEAVAALRELATSLDATAALTPCLKRIDDALAAAATVRASAAPLPCFYAIWTKPWMSIGRQTFVHDVLQTVGFANVCADAAVRYPTVELASIRAAAPAVVLLPDEPWVFDLDQLQQLQTAALFGDARLALCSGRDFSWHGAAMASGLKQALLLRQQLTPMA